MANNGDTCRWLALSDKRRILSIVTATWVINTRFVERHSRESLKHNSSYLFLANSVVATSVVVSCVLLARDHLLGIRAACTSQSWSLQWRWARGRGRLPWAHACRNQSRRRKSRYLEAFQPRQQGVVHRAEMEKIKQQQHISLNLDLTWMPCSMQ